MSSIALCPKDLTNFRKNAIIGLYKSSSIFDIFMIKTEEILIKGQKNKETFCDIFSYEPENIEEASLGSLFMVAQLTGNQDSSHLINLLSSLIKREYYSLPHRGPTASLEAGLKRANSTLSEIANQGNLSWLGKLHFICAAINKEKELFLTQTGSAQAYLYREGELVSITKKIIPSTEKPHPAKTFQNVITGNVAPSDKILFGTPALFESFSIPGLNQLFSFSIEHIADQINKNLREQKKPNPLGALLIEIVAEAPAPQALKQKKDFITPPISLEEIIK